MAASKTLVFLKLSVLVGGPLCVVLGLVGTGIYLGDAHRDTVLSVEAALLGKPAPGASSADAVDEGRLRLPRGVELDPVDGARLVGMLSVQGEEWMRQQLDDGARWMREVGGQLRDQAGGGLSLDEAGLFGDSVKGLW